MPDVKVLLQTLERPVNAVLLAMTLAQVERERMNKLDRELLAATAYNVAPEFAHGRPIERITDPKLAYLMGDEDAAEYHAERQQRIDAMGYRLPRGHCPALCAEEVQREAESVLIGAALVFFPTCTQDSLLCAGLGKHGQYVDLLVRMIVNAPGYMAPKMLRK